MACQQEGLYSIGSVHGETLYEHTIAHTFI